MFSSLESRCVALPLCVSAELAALVSYVNELPPEVVLVLIAGDDDGR
jgi:hypothetical protein